MAGHRLALDLLVDLIVKDRTIGVDGRPGRRLPVDGAERQLASTLDAFERDVVIFEGWRVGIARCIYMQNLQKKLLGK